MKTMSLSSSPAALRAFALVGLVLGGWCLSGISTEAQARDRVHWSIGVNSPGVQVGVSNGPPVVYGYPSYGYPSYSYPSYGYPVYDPRPVVVYPRPVVVHPRPVVVERYPVYVAPQPWGYDERRHRHGDRHRGGRGPSHGHGHGHGHRR
jgi:hypothetical protein